MLHTDKKCTFFVLPCVLTFFVSWGILMITWPWEHVTFTVLLCVFINLRHALHWVNVKVWLLHLHSFPFSYPRSYWSCSFLTDGLCWFNGLNLCVWLPFRRLFWDRVIFWVLLTWLDCFMLRRNCHSFHFGPW